MLTLLTFSLLIAFKRVLVSWPSTVPTVSYGLSSRKVIRVKTELSTPILVLGLRILLFDLQEEIPVKRKRCTLYQVPRG